MNEPSSGWLALLSGMDHRTWIIWIVRRYEKEARNDVVFLRKKYPTRNVMLVRMEDRWPGKERAK